MSTTNDNTTTKPAIATQEQWLEARKKLLEREKAFTHERDALSAARRALPMVKVTKNYVFDEPSGRRRLVDLFDGMRQLIVYHFMFAPDATQGCKSCSYVMDGIASSLVHLPARDTAFTAISRAPVAAIEAFKKRMGFSFRWVSSGQTDFNYDYGVSFRPEDIAAKAVHYNYKTQAFPKEDGPGMSVFLREGEDVFHTYSTYGRGVDLFMSTYNCLDMTPLGRQEENDPYGMMWLRHHDKYGDDNG